MVKPTISHDQWDQSLQAFTTRHAGWLVSIETHDLETQETVTSRFARLEAVELDLEDKNNHRINVIVRDGPKIIKYILFMLGGGAGSLMRYVLGTAINNRFGGRFPLGTVVINITGSFLIGVLMILLTEKFQIDPNWRLLLVVGFLGGYTTFSSFEFETFVAARDGNLWMGLINVVASVVLGFISVWLGVISMKRW